MSQVLGNLKELKKDMESKGWVIDSFEFNFKKQDYIVLVKLYDSDKKKPKYALLKLEFLLATDFSKRLETPANSGGLMIDAKIFIDFFGIETSGKLGDIFSSFYQRLAEVIPENVIDNKNKIQKEVMVQSLSKDDSENESKLYCYKVRRNPLRKDGSLGRRSAYNDNKTRICRPTLYEELKAETNLSFCFSEDPNLDYTNEVIIHNWNQNK